MNSEAVKFAKFMSSFIGATLLPMSKKQKEAYLARIDEKVRIYQPKIEAKTGVYLGKTYVLPVDIWSYQRIFDFYSKISSPNLLPANSLQEDFSSLEKEVYRLIAPFFAVPITAILGSILLAQTKLLNNDGTYLATPADDNCILVPTGIFARQNLALEEEGMNLHLDEKVVHELSHLVWHQIESRNKIKSSRKSKFIDEGFATYCHEEFFSDIYPAGYRIDQNLVCSSYKRGKAKIEQIIARHGKDVFLQIPFRWPEFEKEII